MTTDTQSLIERLELGIGHHEAAARLRELEARVAELTHQRDHGASWLAQMVIDKWNGTDDLPAWVRESAMAYDSLARDQIVLEQRAEKAEAERDALKAASERIRNEFERECDDADKICRKLNLPGSWRTDGGSLHLPRIFAAIDAMQEQKP